MEKKKLLAKRNFCRLGLLKLFECLARIAAHSTRSRDTLLDIYIFDARWSIRTPGLHLDCIRGVVATWHRKVPEGGPLHTNAQKQPWTWAIKMSMMQAALGTWRQGRCKGLLFRKWNPVTGAFLTTLLVHSRFLFYCAKQSRKGIIMQRVHSQHGPKGCGGGWLGLLGLGVIQEIAHC